ncbi:MAG TPA: hypothetical protein PK357_02765 [Candidatus Pacearchaeota archaeon]|nr:hypothetical protein [Candidatus Pacearchaeota archaeon]
MDSEKTNADKFFERITFYNENLNKYFKGYEKNYQFGILQHSWGERTTCLIINDDEGYFRVIIDLSRNYPNHIYNQEGKDIGSHCWNNQLCSIEDDGPKENENGIEFLLRKTEQIKEERYKIKKSNSKPF